MTETELKRLANIQRQRDDMARALQKPLVVSLEMEDDWQFGSRVEPHRERMFEAAKLAKAAAEDRMREVATDILRQFDAQLRAAGIELAQVQS